MAHGGEKREAVQVLDDADAAFVALAPAAFERTADGLVALACGKQLPVVVGYQVGQILVLLFLVIVDGFDAEPDDLLLFGKGMAKQFRQEDASTLHAFACIMIAVGGWLEAHGHGQEAEHHMAEEEGFLLVVGLADVGKQKVGQNLVHTLFRFVFEQQGNEVDRLRLGINHGGIVYRRNQGVDHGCIFLQIQQTCFDNRPVGEDAQGPEHDEQGNGAAHVGQLDHDVLKGMGRRGVHQADAQGTDRFRDVFGDGPDFGGKGVGGLATLDRSDPHFVFGIDLLHLFVPFQQNHVVGEFLLGDDAFFLAVNEEIATRLVLTLAQGLTHMGRQPVQHTVLGLEHHGHTAEQDPVNTLLATLDTTGRNHFGRNVSCPYRGGLRRSRQGHKGCRLAFRPTALLSLFVVGMNARLAFWRTLRLAFGIIHTSL